MKKKEIWMKVTHDKYELPIAVADSVHELSAMTGHSANTIRTSIWHYNRGHTKFPTFARVSIEEEECDGRQAI